MSENNTASSGSSYASRREIRKSFDEFKERKEFLENVNKRFAPLEEINESAKNFGTIGSETLKKEEKITPAIKAATGQPGLGTLKKEAEKDEYVEQLKEEARKLYEDAQKIYAEYKKMDKGSASDEFKVMVAKFMARNKKSMEYLDKMIESLDISIAIKDYERQNSPDNTNTVAGRASRKSEPVSPFSYFVPGKPQPINIPRKGDHTGDSGPVTSGEIEQVLNANNEPSSNTTEPDKSQSPVASYDSVNNTLKANADPVPASEGNTNESSRGEQISNGGRE